MWKSASRVGPYDAPSRTDIVRSTMGSTTQRVVLLHLSTHIARTGDSDDADGVRSGVRREVWRSAGYPDLTGVIGLRAAA
jgi:hypothetical protein